MALTGSDLDDVLVGTGRRDRIAGAGGDDRLAGRSGGDTLTGGRGDDRIVGGEGRDKLGGGRGDDVIFGFGRGDRDQATADIVVGEVAAGLDQPVYATAAPGDPGRLYLVEQHIGRVRILDLDTGKIEARPFLNIPNHALAPGGEQGLLGLAFHPDYASNGRFFVHLTRADGDVVIREYRRSAGDPDRAERSSGDVVLRIDKDNGASNHNGGWLGFDPDGMLYAAIGDEGRSGDPDNNAQNAGELWGKLLRLDVDGDDFPDNPRRDYAIPADNPFADGAGRGEIWALGLRNPWRASFDRATGDLYVGDVGQSEREEIDFQRADSAGGINYGWKVKEGRRVFDDDEPGNPSPDSPELTDPVADYRHDEDGGFAVVGGYVHRGGSQGMRGRYLYADFISGKLWSLRMVDGVAVDVTEHTDQLVGGGLSAITSFAEDADGNLYVVSLDGSIARLDFGAGAGDAADIIVGGAGRDRIFGGAGDDRMAGGLGRDTLRGGAQNDVLDGGAGADRIAGNRGIDVVKGEAGEDTLVGGKGRDTFRFAPGFGADTIADFKDDRDSLRLAGFGLDDADAALALARVEGGDVVFRFGGGDGLTVRDIGLGALADDLLL